MINNYYTLLFTGTCSLNCRYCINNARGEHGHNKTMTVQEMLEQLEKIAEANDPNKYHTTIILTGGEPFLFKEHIFKIFKGYGKRFSFQFNTSGYLFDKKMLRFLSSPEFDVSFNLSIDGDEKLTNYIRPSKDKAAYYTGYSKKFEENVGILLYHFPRTPFKMIVNPRYADTLFDQYLYAERLGFKYFYFIHDQCSNNENILNNSPRWTKEKLSILDEQVKNILTYMISNYKHNCAPLNFANIDRFLSETILDKSSQKVACDIFEGRTLMAVGSPVDNILTSFCLSRSFDNDINKLEKEYDRQASLNPTCLRDKECPYFYYCKRVICMKDGYDKSKNFFDFFEADCEINKIIGKYSNIFLEFFDELAEFSAFQQYLMHILIKGGRTKWLQELKQPAIQAQL